MENLVDVLKNTLDICCDGYYYIDNKKVKLKLSKEEMKKTIVFTDRQISEIIDNTNMPQSKKVNYEVLNIGSFEAAYKLNLECKNSKTLVLNFANPINPGGGVYLGARAQEEDLCRKSTLLLSLESQDAKEYYNFHRKLQSGLSSDYMIISPNVEVFRKGDNSLLDSPFIVSVLTCAAPIITKSINKDQYQAILYHRIKGIISLAIKEEYENLVLGAWGCGAFGNDAEVVAKIFYDVFKELENKASGSSYFNNVVMAVLDRSLSKYNFKAFDRYFGK